uniref:Uncharacterized protein n=1 Tax=Lygus hesperus TaxID=30085 RepID=A0A0A9W572_LYGHE
MYTLTTSGAYGVEESVMGGGAMLSILSILIIPILMGIPTALVVTELTCAVPSDASFLMWFQLSFHRSIYLGMAILSILYTFVDNALYPVLFSDYICSVSHCNRWSSSLLRLGMLLLTFILNVLGIETVGVTTVLLTIFTVAPFACMCIVQQLRSNFYVN